MLVSRASVSSLLRRLRTVDCSSAPFFTICKAFRKLIRYKPIPHENANGQIMIRALAIVAVTAEPPQLLWRLL